MEPVHSSHLEPVLSCGPVVADFWNLVVVEIGDCDGDSGIGGSDERRRVSKCGAYVRHGKRVVRRVPLFHSLVSFCRMRIWKKHRHESVRRVPTNE